MNNNRHTLEVIRATIKEKGIIALKKCLSGYNIARVRLI